MINKRIFLFVLGLYLLITPTFAWLYDWDYRQPINISNTAGDLTNYQVRIDLNSTNIGSNFNWSNDGKDIRFTNSEENLLNYYIKKWDSSGQTAIIWVNVTSLPNNTNTTIYMYYGNPSATSESDAEAVFDFFDDFEDGILDGWNFEGEYNWIDDPTYRYEGHEAARSSLDLTSEGMTACMYQNITLSMQGDITFWWSVRYGGFLRFLIDGSKEIEVDNNYGWDDWSAALSSGTHKIEWCYEQGPEYFGGGYVDYIIIRKQADPEPSVSSFGSEEEKFSITLNSPSNQTITNDNTPDFNFMVSGTETSYSCELFINDTGYGTATANNNTATVITANQSLSDGTYDWYIKCSAGRPKQSEIREITIDTTAPSISNQQISTNYYNGTVNISDYNFITDKKQIKINVSASDIHLDSVWARIYNSIIDYLMSIVSGTIYEVNVSLSKGYYNISSFANDTAGNQNNTANQSITVSDLDLSSYFTVSDYKWDTYEDIIANSTINKVKWINDTGTPLSYKLNVLGYYVNGDSCEVNDVSYSVSGGICNYTHTINKDSVYPDLEFYDSNYGNGTPITQTLGTEQTPTGKWYRNVTLTYYLPNGSTAPQGTFTNATTLTLCLNSIITSGEYIKYYNGTDFVDITPSVYGSWEKKTVNSNIFYVLEDDLCNGDGIRDFKVKVESNMYSQYKFEFGGIVNINPSINAVTLNISNLGYNNEVILQVGVTDGNGLSDRKCVWIDDYFNCSFGELNPVVVNITNNLSYFGTIYANDSQNNIDSYDINYSFTNNSYFHNSSTSKNLSYQEIYKIDNLKNNAGNSLKYFISHANNYLGTLISGGNFSGELSSNSNITLTSNWYGDWLSETDSQYIANTTEAGGNAWIKRDINNTIDINFTNIQNIDREGWTCTKEIINISANQFIENATICNKTNVITKQQSNNTIYNDTVIVDSYVNAYYFVNGSNTDTINYSDILVQTTLPDWATNTSPNIFSINLNSGKTYNLTVNITGKPAVETEYSFTKNPVGGGEKNIYLATVKVYDSAVSDKEVWYYVPKSRLLNYEGGVSKLYIVDDKTSGFSVQDTNTSVIFKIPTTFGSSSFEPGNHTFKITYWTAGQLPGGGGGVPTTTEYLKVEPETIYLNITQPGNYTIKLNITWSGPTTTAKFDYSDELIPYIVSPKKFENIELKNTTTINITFYINDTVLAQQITTLIKRISGKISIKVTHMGAIYLRYIPVDISVYKGVPPPPTTSVCGNGVCEPGENWLNCPEDCGGERIIKGLIILVISGVIIMIVTKV